MCTDTEIIGELREAIISQPKAAPVKKAEDWEKTLAEHDTYLLEHRPQGTKPFVCVEYRSTTPKPRKPWYKREAVRGRWLICPLQKAVRLWLRCWDKLGLAAVLGLSAAVAYGMAAQWLG